MTAIPQRQRLARDISIRHCDTVDLEGDLGQHVAILGKAAACKGKVLKGLSGDAGGDNDRVTGQRHWNAPGVWFRFSVPVATKLKCHLFAKQEFHQKHQR